MCKKMKQSKNDIDTFFTLGNDDILALNFHILIFTVISNSLFNASQMGTRVPYERFRGAGKHEKWRYIGGFKN